MAVDDIKTIEEKRAQRRLKKESQAAKGSDLKETAHKNEYGFHTGFTKRALLPIPSARAPKGITHFCIMTYNVLAQSLIRRKLFPLSGEALKWKNRQQVLLLELAHYKSSIMCLQECGLTMLQPCLHEFFTKHNYAYTIHCGKGKAHGVLIAYSKNKFDVLHTQTINYDDDLNSKDSKPRKFISNNVGLIVVLRERASGCRLIVSTTHLFWHPLGTCERLRQCRLLRRTISEVKQVFPDGTVILAGDFNTEPRDPIYRAMTMRPFAMDSYGSRIIKESNLHTSFPAEEVEASITDGQGQDLLETALCSTDYQVLDGIESAWDVSAYSEDDIDSLISADQLVSAYGLYYKEIMPIELECELQTGEPPCTNYAHAYRGTLDYIFTERSQEQLVCTRLLAMPDLSLLTHGQPEEKKFCSDHFCMLAEFGVKNSDRLEN